jgi:hypothetical protein
LEKIWRRKMNHAEEEFIQMVQNDYGGLVKIAVLFDVRNEKRLGFLEGRGRCQLSCCWGNRRL